MLYGEDQWHQSQGQLAALGRPGDCNDADYSRHDSGCKACWCGKAHGPLARVDPTKGDLLLTAPCAVPGRLASRIPACLWPFLFDTDQPSHVACPVSETANSDSATFVRTRALKIGNAGQVAPIGKLSVVMVAIIAAVFLREKMSPI